MCRCYYINIIKHLALQKIVKNYSGEVKPGQKAPVVIYINGQYMTTSMIWGFPINDQYIYNARSETVLEKPFFQCVFQQRCLVPVSGFYEWNKDQMQISYELDKPFYLAGIYQNGHFCILTTKANKHVKHIHHRMPLVLQGDDVKIWLSADFKKVLKGNDYQFHLEIV